MIKKLLAVGSLVVLFAPVGWGAESKGGTGAAAAAAAQPQKPEAAKPSRADAIAAYFHRPVSEVQDLRSKGFGFREIIKMLVIADMSKRPLPELLAKHKEGYGWGTISRQLGLKLSEVKQKLAEANRQLKVRAAKPSGAKKARSGK
jgi:hypothetical protein